jgi:hypothetical protein
MTSSPRSPGRVVPAALQRQLPVADPRLRVLVTINGARQWEAFRGYNENDFLWLIENGYVVAFDISLRAGQDESARELRIFPDSLDHYARTDGHPKAKKNPFALTWERVLFPNQSDALLLSTRAQVILNCSCAHIGNLIEARLLKQPEGAKERSRGHAAVITRDSFLSFLKSRREDPC